MPTFIYSTSENVETFFENKNIYEENGYPYFEGFDLMSPVFFSNFKERRSSEQGTQYLMAVEDEEIVGILKWKRYGVPFHEFVSEELADEVESYVAIRLVDVKKEYQRKGIALSLIREWGTKYLRPNDKVVGGKETEKGAEAHIHEWLERELDQRYFVSELEIIAEWEEENEEW